MKYTIEQVQYIKARNRKFNPPFSFFIHRPKLHLAI